MMPRQARKPCSGCARSLWIRSHSAAVAGPIATASLRDALDGPAGVAPMAGGHVLRRRGVLVVAAHALMRGDPLALVENLDGAGGEADLDLGADEAMRDAVVVRLDLDVIVDA